VTQISPYWPPRSSCKYLAKMGSLGSGSRTVTSRNPLPHKGATKGIWSPRMGRHENSNRAAVPGDATPDRVEWGLKTPEYVSEAATQAFLPTTLSFRLVC
jgi:hypothetical protein